MATSLSIASTSPQSSAVLHQSPSVLTVTFDRPLDSFSVGNVDFEIVHVAADGSTSKLNASEASYSEGIDPSDPTGSRIALTLSRSLAAGHYQLILLGSNQLTGQDGTTIANPSQNRVVSEFTLAPKSDGLSYAVNLGSPSSSETVRSGNLDLDSNPNAVKLYKISLKPGHFWRLGLEITSQDDEDALQTTLSLFDSKGRLITTDSLGLPNAPNDPYLFEGLAAGSYYVGVSGAGNVPETPGGYDPSQSIAGTSGITQEGGPFRLHLVVDPVDKPTTILGLQVDHADPLSSEATGLTLAFSGPISLAGLEVVNHPIVTLVDQQGQNWSLTPLGYNSASAQLSFAFNQSMPAGHYTLELGDQSALIDLAGQPLASTGQANSVLGSFDLTSTTLPSGDLGPILTSVAQPETTSAVIVGPGSSTTEQLVVVVPGVYIIKDASSSDPVSLTLANANGQGVVTPITTSQGTADEYQLDAGSYSLTVANQGTSAVNAVLTIRRKATLLAVLLEGGVAQGAALNLRLVTPSPNFGQGSQPVIAGPTPIGSTTSEQGGTGPQAPSPVAPTVAPSPLTPSAVAPSPVTSSPVAPSPMAAGSVVSTTTTDPVHDPVSTEKSVVGPSSPLGLSTAFFLVGNGPVGHPSANADQIGIVGPSSLSGSVAIASNSPGLPPGLQVVPKTGETIDRLERVVPEDRLGSSASPGSPLFENPPAAIDMLGSSTTTVGTDDLTLARGAWIENLVASAMTIFGPGPASAIATLPEELAEGSWMAAEAPTSALEEPRIEVASLGTPIGIGVLAAMAFRYRRRLFAAFRKKSGRKVKDKAFPILQGPHRRTRVVVR